MQQMDARSESSRCDSDATFATGAVGGPPLLVPAAHPAIPAPIRAANNSQQAHGSGHAAPAAKAGKANAAKKCGRPSKKAKADSGDSSTRSRAEEYEAQRLLLDSATRRCLFDCA